MLSTDEVKHNATLARIGITEDELKRYQGNLSAVLDFFRELQTLDTSGDLESGIPVKENDTRDDVVITASAMTQDIIRDNFPETKDGYLKVRSVF